MGKEIEKIAVSRGHEILDKLDTPDDWIVRTSHLSQADMVLEFSTPGSVLGNIRRCFDLRLPIVVGTTGWHSQANLVKTWCAEENQSIFVASNFSIGVNILYNLTEKLSKILDRFGNYDISLEEIHHIHKLDSPSGTAINIAEIILNNLKRKESWVNHATVKPGELEIISHREGEIPGIHKIKCESETERLILQHEAKGRQGLAIGAILAAEWLKGKQGYFGMNDLLNLNE